MQITANKKEHKRGLRVIMLTTLALLFFVCGTLTVKAQTLEITPTIIETMSDTITVDIGGAYCASMENVPYWVAFSPDGNQWSNNCEGFTDAPFSENFADLPGIWTILNFTFSDRNTPSADDLNCYEGNLTDCLSSASYSGLSQEIYYQYEAPTSTPTTTPSQEDNRVENLMLYTILFLAIFGGTFIITNKFT